MSRLRFSILVACLTVAGLLVGCGSDGEDGTTTAAKPPSGEDRASQPPPLQPPPAEESIPEAQERIAAAVSTGDCDEINALNPISRPGLATEQRCEYLRRLDGLEMTGAAAYSDAAAVIDYRSGDRTLSALLVRDSDGLFHIAWLDPFRGVPSVDTRFAKEFDDVADAAVDALANRDCDAFLEIASRRFGPGIGEKGDVCPRVEQHPVVNALEAFPKTKPERLGGGEGYAFYRLATPGIHYTLVLAEQTESSAPEGAPQLPEDASRYAFVDAYVTNRAEEDK